MRKFMTVLCAVFMCGFLLSMNIEAEAAGTFNTIEKGVYIGDIDVSGMTTLEAEEAVNSYVDSLKEKEITWNALNDNTVTVTAADLGIKWKNKEVVDQAGELGKAGNIVQRYKALKDLEHQNEVFPLEITFDEALIRTLITDQCLQYNVKAVDGTLTREDGAFKYVAGQTGVEIDVEASVKMVFEYLGSEWDKENVTIDLVAETTQPRGTAEELAVVKDLLGSFTTSYSTSGYNRSGNVANGASKINGTLLYPGDAFSTYEAVSPFTEANGYYEAGSYLNGLVIDSLGGGICQVSTTLYNAVLLAELEVTERFNHSMIVTYVDPSADAAISGTAKDFKFVNNLDYPVYIEGYTTDDKKITFNIYGCETRPEDRKIKYESIVISKTVPEGERVVADSAQPAGFIDVQSAHIGYVAELWKVVTVDGVEESREQINKSSYTATPRTAAVGTATPNPWAAQAINAAIATGSIDQCRAVAAAINAGAYNDPVAAAFAAQQMQAQADAAAAAAAAAQQQQADGATQ
nr:VanW family protein [Lachnospiraceae bacterium]